MDIDPVYDRKGLATNAGRHVPPKLLQVHPAETDQTAPARRNEPTPQAQLEQKAFEEPVVTEAREDPGTNVAPARYNTPLDPHAPM